MVFPAPTLARNVLGSNMSLTGFATGASFDSTNLPDFGAGCQAPGLSREAAPWLPQFVIACAVCPVSQRLPLDRRQFYGEGRFFERLGSWGSGRHLPRFQ